MVQPHGDQSAQVDRGHPQRRPSWLRARPRGQPQTVTLRRVEPGRPPQPVQLDLVFRTERPRRSTPTTPAAPSPASPPASGWPPTPTCCAMPWPRPWRPTRSRPASSPPSCATPTAAPSPSGSTSTSSPDRTPAGRADRGRVRPSGQGWAREIGGASGGGKPEGNLTLKPHLMGRPTTALVLAQGLVWQGQDSNLCRQCRRFYRSHRHLPARPIPSPPAPIHRFLTQHRWPVDCFALSPTSLSVSPRPAPPSVVRREVGGKSLPPSEQSAWTTTRRPLGSEGPWLLAAEPQQTPSSIQIPKLYARMGWFSSAGELGIEFAHPQGRGLSFVVRNRGAKFTRSFDGTVASGPKVRLAGSKVEPLPVQYGCQKCSKQSIFAIADGVQGLWWRTPV